MFGRGDRGGKGFCIEKKVLPVNRGQEGEKDCALGVKGGRNRRPAAETLKGGTEMSLTAI